MNVILRNWLFRVIALLAAVVLWLHVTTDREYQTVISVPFEVINLPENLAVASPVPETGEITIRGTGKSILALKVLSFFGRSYVRITLDAFDAKLGNTACLITRDQVFIPRNLEIEVLLVKSPRQLAVQFDSKLSKRMPVTPRVEISCAEKFIYDKNFLLNPDSINVEGPRASVTRLDKVYSRLVKIRELQRDTSWTIFLDKPSLPGLVLIPNKVKILVRVDHLEKKELSNLPVSFINLPDTQAVEFSTREINLSLAGPSRIIKTLGEKDVNVVLDYRRYILEDQAELTPVIKVFGDVTWFNLQPPKIRLLSVNPKSKGK